MDEADLAGRTDFRGLPTVTIDGEHARDFDDAITLETLRNGHYWLGVHIADVSHYVEEGSPLDVEAYDRGTSVYFPERALHMFPPQLATGLCSLRPHVDRLVQSCLMEVTRSGDVVRAEFHDGVIVSDERMTYTDVNAILDGDSAVRKRYAPLVPLFELMRDLFAVLNGRRRRRGSVDFDLPQAEVLMDEAGRIENIVAAERNVAHRLIEEFMLLANETVADHLESQGGPGLYRIHEEPDPVKVSQFEEFISGFGLSLAAPINALRPRHFQRLVEKIAGRPEERPIAFLMLKTMQKARYAPENMGHFGLAAASYTLIGAIIVLGGLGYFADTWLGTSPWLLLLGLLLGIVVGFYELAMVVWGRRAGEPPAGSRPARRRFRSHPGSVPESPPLFNHLQRL